MTNDSSVWRFSSGAANEMLRRPVLALLSPADRLRAERLRQARMLYQGQHRAYFLDEGRSQFAFPPLRDGEKSFYTPLNLLTLLSRKNADLLFGEPARIHADDAAVQQRLDAVVARSWLGSTLLSCAVDASWAGEALIEVSRRGDAAYLDRVSPDEIFPTGGLQPDRQFRRYVRYATASVGEQALLLETTYSAGKIERKLFALATLDVSGPQRTRELTLDAWPVRREDGSPLPDEEETGLDRPSIVRIPNGPEGVSDYDGLIELQDAMSAKQTQIARVLAKHADPKLAAPEASADEKGNLPAAAEVFFFRSKDEIPAYITWNAELAAAMEDRRFALLAFATAAEMPLSLLGVKDDSIAESAAKMRLNAASALAKAGRSAAHWTGGLRLALRLACLAEGVSIDERSVGVEIRDGLPDDEEQRANVVATLRSAGVMSRRRALAQQWLDPAGVEKELAELDGESNSSMPASLLADTEAA